MELKTEAIRVSSRKNRNLNRIVYRLIPQPVAIRDMNEASAPSITMSDMEAYVGLSELGARRAARSKVAEFSRARLILQPVLVESLV